MHVLRRYRLRGIVAAGRKPTYSICLLMSQYAPHESDAQWEAYVKEKMHEYGMSDAAKVAAWLIEVSENSYFAQSILTPLKVREQDGMLALFSTAESTRQYHVNVEQYQREGMISEPHWLLYQVCRHAGRESGGLAYRVCMKHIPPQISHAYYLSCLRRPGHV